MTNGLAIRRMVREVGIIPTQQKATMEKPQLEKMRHMSLLLPKEEHEAFRFLCCQWKISHSEALRAMVRIALGGGYQKENIEKGAPR